MFLIFPKINMIRLIRNNLDNKKPQHPAGVSHIGLLGMTPVLPHAPGAIFLILVVWNILFSMTSS